MDSSTLSPADVKRRLGLSTKQLRLYTDKGLIRPQRKPGGWRVFGRADLERLYQVKVLRNFGFTLEQIATLLNARGKKAQSFASVLRLQVDTLRAEQERVAQALLLLADAEKLLAAGGALEVGDLVELSLRAGRGAEPELMTNLRPFIERYFNERDYRAASQASAKNWQALIDEGMVLAARGVDPNSATAHEFRARWLALSKVYSGGDAELEDKSRRAFEDAMSQKDVSKHPIPLALFNFLKAIRASQE
jgi:DNA-binding transcriptional MerR regulator